MGNKYSERLKYYKNDNEPNTTYTYSGSGCLFHNIDEFRRFSDVDDDELNSIDSYTYSIKKGL